MIVFWVAALMAVDLGPATADEAVRTAQHASQNALPSNAVVAAMRTAVAGLGSDIDIEVVETSHFPVPSGEIQFALKDLAPFSSNGTARWRGSIVHHGDQHFSIWAIVRITGTFHRVVATTTLRPGEAIQADQVREESYRGAPPKMNSIALADVVGRAAARFISAGAEITGAGLTDPILIEQGASATADYDANGVRLTIPVVAEQSGRLGDVIAVRNSATRKILSAKVIGVERVMIQETSVRSQLNKRDTKR